MTRMATVTPSTLGPWASVPRMPSAATPPDPPDPPGADPRHLTAALALVATARPRCGDVLVVAVDGPSGAGKTTLAEALAQALRDRRHAPELVHLDDLIPGWDGLAAAAGLLDTQVLAPLARGEDAAYRSWDWHESRWGAMVSVSWTPLLVVEGCGSSVRPAGDRAAVRIWVEAPTAVRMARGIARDREAYRRHWERWAAQERALFAADGTRARADLRVDTSPPSTPPPTAVA